MTLCSWEGSCRSGRILAMHYRFQWSNHLWEEANKKLIYIHYNPLGKSIAPFPNMQSQWHKEYVMCLLSSSHFQGLFSGDMFSSFAVFFICCSGKEPLKLATQVSHSKKILPVIHSIVSKHWWEQPNQQKSTTVGLNLSWPTARCLWEKQCQYHANTLNMCLLWNERP